MKRQKQEIIVLLKKGRIDESKANLDATQKPNMNLDLAVKREIVGISIDLDGGHSRHDKAFPNLWKLK